MHPSRIVHGSCGGVAMPYSVSNPVNFYAGGDTTSQAIGKHIAEIARIYDILNDGLDSAKSVVVVLSPNTVLKDEQLGITPAPLEIKRGNGVQRWSELPDGIWLAQAIDNLTSDDGVAPLSARQGKLLKELIDAVPKTEVVNDLTTGGSGKALSAEQGKALKALIDALTTPVPGPPGPKGIEWRGAWDGAVAYRKDDAVSYRGGSYIALKPSTGEPPTNAEFWGVLSAKGADGIGAGDMTKAVYDPDGDGKVDAAVVADTANAVAWDDVTGKPEKFTCDIVDALDSDRADAALSAAQGKVLDKKIAGLPRSLTDGLAGTIWVAPDGDDATADGSETKPFKDLQFVLNRLPQFAPRGVYDILIKLKPGIYRPKGAYGIHNICGGNIVIEGVGDGVKLYSPGAGNEWLFNIVYAQTRITMKNVEIGSDEADPAKTPKFGLRCVCASSVILENVVFRNIQAPGDETSAIISETSNMFIANSRFDKLAHGIFATAMSKIGLVNTQTLTPCTSWGIKASLSTVHCLNSTLAGTPNEALDAGQIIRN